MGMRICVLTGSPHLKGTSNTLAEEWMRGAQEAGHTVERCDCARPNLHPCLGCGHCGMDDPCVHRDDGEGVLETLLQADMVLFATPIYYFGVSA
ncbi:flavodoxin family protein [bacterium 210917-SL.2.15]|nr:flavodoxin family protein [bacterium 210917-SL.2.15]